MLWMQNYAIVTHLSGEHNIEVSNIRYLYYLNLELYIVQLGNLKALLQASQNKYYINI